MDLELQLKLNIIETCQNKKLKKKLKKLCEEISKKKIKETLKLKKKLETSLNNCNSKILKFDHKSKKIKKLNKKKKNTKKIKNNEFLFLKNQKICLCNNIKQDDLLQCINPYVI